MEQIQANQAFYIKLGKEGGLERKCFEDGSLRIDFREVPHDLAVSGDEDAIAQVFQAGGANKTVATRKARQLARFYNTDPDIIWYTFSDGYLWWAKLKPTIVSLDQNPASIASNGSRLRETIDGWHNTNISGVVLDMTMLSGRLTQTAASRNTICDCPDFEYLLRKINGEKVRQVWLLENHREELLKLIVDVMRLLTPEDFELLIDLIFSASGWRRIGAVGGSQKTSDLQIELPTTQERAFVQVKSTTNQKTFDQYASDFQNRYEQRMFFAYHSAGNSIDNSDPDITLLGPEQLAPMTLNAGLVDWLIERTS